MCRPIRCKQCGKTTWAGCGRHVDQVMGQIPPADRCPGHPNPPQNSKSSAWRRFLGR